MVLKEVKKERLRGAEINTSSMVFGERIDHSVIHYWEKRLREALIEGLLKRIGKILHSIIRPNST